MIPDIEQIVGDYLRGHADVAALTSRVGGRTPRTLSDGWVRVTQYDDQPAASSRALHLVGVSLQIDCYGSDSQNTAHAEASLLARTVRAALNDLPDSDLAAGVISGVRFDGGLKRIPDSSIEPARERFVLDCTVWCHP